MTTEYATEIKIYHIEGRRSERVIWLLEELNMPYELIYKRGELLGSMMLIKEVNPLMPVAPTVVIDGQVLVESAAIIQIILDRFAPSSSLRPEIQSKAYPAYMQWLHFAESAMAFRAFSDYKLWRVKTPSERSMMVDTEASMEFVEDFLSKHAYFGGDEFSAADIMMLLPLNAATDLNVVDGSHFPLIAAWKEKVKSRDAFKAMIEKALPDGMIGALPKLKTHAPSGPRGKFHKGTMKMKALSFLMSKKKKQK